MAFGYAGDLRVSGVPVGGLDWWGVGCRWAYSQPSLILGTPSRQGQLGGGIPEVTESEWAGSVKWAISEDGDSDGRVNEDSGG